MNKVTVKRWAKNQNPDVYVTKDQNQELYLTRIPKDQNIEKTHHTKMKLASFNSHYKDRRRYVQRPVYPYPPPPPPPITRRYEGDYVYQREESRHSNWLVGWCSLCAIITCIILAIFLLLIIILFILFGYDNFLAKKTTTSDDYSSISNINLASRNELIKTSGKKSSTGSTSSRSSTTRSTTGSTTSNKRGADDKDNDTLKFTFHVGSQNVTEAALHCSLDGQYLVTFDGETDETDMMEQVKNNPDFLKSCNDAFIGYRAVQDKEWLAGDYEAFGGFFSSMWDTSAYESGQETCAHAAKVFNYKLNTIACFFPNDCVMCQKVSSMERAIVHCRKKINGVLGVVANAVMHNYLLQALKSQDPNRTCTAVALGMVFHRKLENLNEIVAKYPPSTLEIGTSQIIDNCIVFIVKSNSKKKFKFVDCRKRTCFICAS